MLSRNKLAGLAGFPLLAALALSYAVAGCDHDHDDHEHHAAYTEHHDGYDNNTYDRHDYDRDFH